MSSLLFVAVLLLRRSHQWFVLDLFFSFFLFSSRFSLFPLQISPTLVEAPTYTLLRTSNGSKLFSIGNTGYKKSPMLVSLVGSRYQAGYAYAALLHKENVDAYTSFMSSMFNARDQRLLSVFLDFCWLKFLEKHVAQGFKDELRGMQDWHTEHGMEKGLTTDGVARFFYTVANMPADPVNIVAMLEEELEPASWPWWLKDGVNELVKLLEKLLFGCDAYGVWGSRTRGGLVYSSRNLDWNTNTGIDAYKLVVLYKLDGIPPYVSLGFAVGLGALAGQSSQGLTVSEMNLDNSVVTFEGPPFPLRLRMVLESGSSLEGAMRVWNATNNTNSFNFLVASSADGKAYALETIRGFTQQYADNSPVEAAATYNCGSGNACREWTSQRGVVHIGKPLPEVVFRSNHAFSPSILPTQEPLFNDTVFRYDLQHDLFAALTGTPIDDVLAVSIVATLGTKGPNFLTCAPQKDGENVMSISYAPGPRSASNKYGWLHIAWEQGKGSNATWTPAACNPYVKINFDSIIAL